MFGYIHKLEANTVTLEVPSLCDSRLLKCHLNGIKTPLEVGLKVRFEAERRDNNLPKLTGICRAAFDTCTDCNKPYEITDAQVICECFGRKIIKGNLKITAKEERSYQYGPGIKLSMKLGNRIETYHAVIFSNSPFYDFAQELKVDDFCRVKGEIKEENYEHVLIRVFVFDTIM